MRSFPASQILPEELVVLASTSSMMTLKLLMIEMGLRRMVSLTHQLVNLMARSKRVTGVDLARRMILLKSSTRHWRHLYHFAGHSMSRRDSLKTGLETSHEVMRMCLLALLIQYCDHGGLGVGWNCHHKNVQLSVVCKKKLDIQ